ncbi:MAG: hypothetical protein M1829_001694 [Trizodia sp. TS-e1964]|nr:MAG: hypothetical protein M1829_001694 [Trizodia sp. TS-e1964]
MDLAMADSLESLSSPHPSPDSRGLRSSPISFKFPLLPINEEECGRFLTGRGFDMSLQEEDIRSLDGYASSLGDSTYDIVEEAVAYTDEEAQDDNTDSCASIDGHGIDDVASIADTDFTDDTASSIAESHGIPTFGGLDQPTEADDITGSGTTITDDDSYPRPPLSIEFEEPPSFGSDQISVIHTISHYTEEQTIEILRHLHLDNPPDHLIATIRQTMTKDGLELTEPLTVLYIGDSEARGDILAKIGAAFVVRSLTSSYLDGSNYPPSRFNVVQYPASESSRPTAVELVDSLGHQMIADECTSALNSKVDGKPDTLTLFCADKIMYSSKREDAGYTLELPGRWKLPHIAIFFSTEQDSMMVRQTRFFARSLMARHMVPTLFISENSHLSKLSDKTWDIHGLDPHSLHICLESRSAGPLGNRVHRRLPIDLTTFLNMDARQMNRNLAFLTGLHDGRDITRPSTLDRNISLSTNGLATLDLEKMSHGSDQKGDCSFKLQTLVRSFPALLAFFLTCLMSGVMLALIHQRHSEESWGGSDNAIQIVRTSSATGALSTISPSSLQTTTISVLNTAPSSRAFATPNSLAAAPNLDIASMLLESAKSMSNDSAEFKMHIIGDCHMILRPPLRFRHLRKAPKLFVTVTRDDKEVEVQLSTLFEGVYALRLEREDAYGSLNVTVWTVSKPIIQQTFELDFGNAWFKVAGWKRAAKSISKQLGKDIFGTRNGLQRALDGVSVVVKERTITRGQAWKGLFKKLNLKSISRKSQSKTAIIGKLWQASLQKYAHRRESALENLRARAHRFSSGIAYRMSGIHAISPKAYTLSLLREIPDIRRYEPFAQAHRQAHHIWDQFAKRMSISKSSNWLSKRLSNSFDIGDDADYDAYHIDDMGICAEPL